MLRAAPCLFGTPSHAAGRDPSLCRSGSSAVSQLSPLFCMHIRLHGLYSCTNCNPTHCLQPRMCCAVPLPPVAAAPQSPYTPTPLGSCPQHSDSHSYVPPHVLHSNPTRTPSVASPLRPRIHMLSPAFHLRRHCPTPSLRHPRLRLVFRRLRPPAAAWPLSLRRQRPAGMQFFSQRSHAAQ